MANEITAEELAEWIANSIGCEPRDWDDDARSFLILTRAHAALMAERAKPVFGDLTVGLGKMQTERAKDAPERVQCWAWEYDGSRFATFDETYTERLMDGITITPGWFTPDTKTGDE